LNTTRLGYLSGCADINAARYIIESHADFHSAYVKNYCQNDKSDTPQHIISKAIFMIKLNNKEPNSNSLPLVNNSSVPAPALLALSEANIPAYAVSRADGSRK
jgi:hypothetical protein